MVMVLTNRHLNQHWGTAVRTVKALEDQSGPPRSLQEHGHKVNGSKQKHKILSPCDHHC